MASSTTLAERGAPQHNGDERWTTRALIARHRRLSIAAVAVFVVMVVTIVLGITGSSRGAVSDTTSCSGWGSANQNQQQAFAALYIREHGALPSGATDLASVEAAINKGCMQAYGSDVADTVNVYQAINKQY